MDDELAPIFEAWDKESGDGRDADEAYRLSDEYVDSHPDEFAGFEGLGLEDCVSILERRREAGDPGWAKMQVWLWHRFEPQNIGGVYQPTLRVTNGR